jgi:hypothetical protein
LFKIPDAAGDVRVFVSESAGEGVASLITTFGTSLICKRKEFRGFHQNCKIIKKMADNVEMTI